MITVEQAENIILQNASLTPIEVVPLLQSYNRIIRENIKADRDSPAFHKSTMDGIAVNYQQCLKKFRLGDRSFLIKGIIPAGVKPLDLKNQNDCVQIMTGAALPNGLDCVIPIEYVRIARGVATVNASAPVQLQQFVRLRAADHKKGELFIKAGARMGSPEIAIAAAFGKSEIKVSAHLKVAIISTGDEIVSVDVKTIQPYQTRQSNACALYAALVQSGLAQGTVMHIQDDPKKLTRGIGQALEKFDVLVLSGGVSKGEFDFVPRVLHLLGVRELFYKVAQKPGKPFWFGKSKKGKMVFALAGNPVSTQICAARYVIPFLEKSLGIVSTSRFVRLMDAVNGIKNFVHFVPVKSQWSAGAQLEAKPIMTGGSGDFASLSATDGFVELKAKNGKWRRNSLVRYFSWKVNS